MYAVIRLRSGQPAIERVELRHIQPTTPTASSNNLRPPQPTSLYSPPPALALSTTRQVHSHIASQFKPDFSTMDEDQTSTFPSLGNLSLNDDFLADQDYGDQSNILDASFEYDSQPQPGEDDTDLLAQPTVQSSAPDPNEYAYHGSMRPAPLPPTSRAPTTHNPRATPPTRTASQPRAAAAEEDDELSADASEEDRKRWEELRNERDRLRAVNRMLLQVSAGFDAVEGKMEVSEDGGWALGRAREG